MSHKTLILMRHGHATDATYDKRRPLSTRGIMQATLSAQRIATLSLTDPHILASDAIRAQQTADILCRQLASAHGVETVQSLFTGLTTNDLLTHLSPDDDCIIVVGHNPDISIIADMLSAQSVGPSFPPAGFVALTFNVHNWQSIIPHSGNIILHNLG
mgnify:CR=1 FL=1